MGSRRVNGVYRGGQVDSSSADKQCVSYRSSYPVLSYVNKTLGFRCGVGVNGVRVDRGGRWGLGPDYIRCSYRDRSSQGSGGDKVGFR